MKKYEDKTLSKEERISEYNKEIDKLMNPIPEEDFDRETFDPIKIEGMEDLVVRKRAIKKGKLPTYGLLPKEIREGQMIGMYESKQDLYLLFAHKYNELLDEIEKLKKLIK
jgi:hypothetical protein